jgi:tetratricopeptide (TPR) repeat protein
MTTLYDLLGALPDDDAESLRMAFRKAAKASHPDVNADDPDAPSRFRRIVRAHAILSDAAQRATYDRLMSVARVRRVLSDALMVVVISVVSIGGYALFSQRLDASVAPLEADVRPSTAITAVTAAKQGEAIVAPAPPPSDRPEQVNEPIHATAPAAPPSPAQAFASAGPALDLAVKDAKSFRDQGSLAYRDGDLRRALSNLDQAIQLDPGFADAYIDRGIVLYRMGEADLAFADVAQARRLEGANRLRTARATPRKAAPSSAGN